MSEKEMKAIYKAINNVSNKVNDVYQKLDEVIQAVNKLTNEKITINSDGIDGLGDVIATHDEAIDNLASMLALVEEKEEK